MAQVLHAETRTHDEILLIKKGPLRLSDGTVTPTVMYGSAPWTQTVELENNQQRTQRQMLRMVLSSPMRRHTNKTSDETHDHATETKTHGHKETHTYTHKHKHKHTHTHTHHTSTHPNTTRTPTTKQTTT